MARNNYRRRIKKKERYSELEKLAYKLGQISRGRENRDSLISASYNAGAAERERRPRKTLF